MAAVSTSEAIVYRAMEHTNWLLHISHTYLCIPTVVWLGIYRVVIVYSYVIIAFSPPIFTHTSM